MGREDAAPYSASRGLKDCRDIHPPSAAATYAGTSAWHRRRHSHSLHGIHAGRCEAEGGYRA